MPDTKPVMVTMLNPFTGALCDVPIEMAKKFLDQVEDLKKQVAAKEGQSA